jgi:serine/threonine protein kinase
MTSRQWEEVKERFHEALGQPAETRHSFLLRACPDAVVRTEVARLLTEHGRAGSFLGQPAASPSNHFTGPTDHLDGHFDGTSRFEVLERLGAGAFGAVYRVFDRERNSIVALKKLLHDDAGQLLRFKHEFRSLTGVVHTNLVQLYELFGENGNWFFTMELVHGVDFLSWVRPAGSVDNWDRLRAALFQLAVGVRALHESGRLHRDLKPSNVLVEANGRVVILDFGLVREFRAESFEQSFTLAGSPAYMAPELAAGRPAGRAADEAADWYSVGVMLYKALTGQLPFAGQWNELPNRKWHKAASARDLAADVPEDLDDACRHLLEPEPRLRARGRVFLLTLGTAIEKAEAPREDFVGRAPELRLLRESFETVRSGKCQSVFVQGPSGMGKTSFLAHFLSTVRHDRKDAVILAGRCRESESLPYKALDPIVDELVKFLRRQPEAFTMAMLPRHPDLLRRLFPVFSDVGPLSAFPDRSAADLDEQQIRRRAFEALRELLGRMTDRNPVVIAIDDLQWGDLDSIAFLSELILSTSPPALLLILSFRSERAESNPALQVLRSIQQRLADPGSCLEIRLSGLSVDEGRILLQQLQAANRPIAGEQLGEILSQSGGSPLLLNELLRYASRESDANGSLKPAAGVLISDMIRHRAATLPATARGLLEALSVAGEPVSRTLLAAALPGTAEEPARDTGLLIQDRLVRFAGGARADELEPFHDQVREAALSWISPADLRSWHSRLAQVLETEKGADPQRLLRHYRGAGDQPAAFRSALAAAANAEAALAFEQAARFYAEAIETGQAGKAEWADLHLKRAKALAKAGRGYEAAQSYLQSAASPECNDPVEMKRAGAEQLIRSGYLDEGTQIFTDLARSIGVHLPARRLELLLRMLVLRAFIRVRGLRWRERPEASVSPSALRKMDVLWCGAATLITIDTIAGTYLHAKHMLAALRAGEPFRLSLSLSFATVYECLGGTREYAHGQRLLGLADGLAERRKDPYLKAIVFASRSGLDLLCGRVVDGLSHSREGIVRLQAATGRGRAWEMGTLYWMLIWFLGWGGRIRELSEAVPVMADEAKARGDIYTEVSVRCNGSSHLVELAADMPERALAGIDRSMNLWRKTSFDLPHLLAAYASVECLLYANRTEEAREVLLSRWQPIWRSLYARKSQPHRIILFNLRARTALAQWLGKTASRESRTEIEQFAGKLAAIGSPWAAGFSLLLRAGVAVGLNRRGEAIVCLENAERLLREQDLRLIAAAALRRRGELRGDDGSGLVETADAFMRSENILRPDRMTAMFLPGDWSISARSGIAAESGEFATRAKP